MSDFEPISSILNFSSTLNEEYFGYDYELNDSEYYNAEWFLKFFISFVVYLLTFIIGNFKFQISSNKLNI
jgi:hypothetical protein